MTRDAKWHPCRLGRLLLLVGLTTASPGCFSVLAGLRCDDGRVTEPHRQPDCDRIEEAADEADEAIFDAVTAPRGDGGTLLSVAITGMITDDGRPVARVAVRLVRDGSIQAIVRSGPDGAYELSALVEPDECEELRLEVGLPDGGWGPPSEPSCGTRSLDYDLASSRWSGS